MEKKQCVECVLVESAPDIFLDSNGVCNICNDYKKQTSEVSGEPDFLETDFLKILNKYRGQGKYDCLCMLSGGKDSTASLYYIVEKYKMNPLVFTFNHGFVPKDHIASAQKTVEKLGVDWIYFETDFMKEMFKKIVQTKSKVVICPVCSLWYMLKTYEIASQWNIPIIISGWTKGQTTSSKKSVLSKCACDQDPEEYSQMANATKEFMEKHVHTDPRYKDFPTSMEEVLQIARKKYKTKAIVLSPHWFVPSHPDIYVPIIKEKLGWDYPEMSYPKKSTNCELNFLASKLAVENYGYSHYHIEMSNLIRMGMITREEALSLLEIDFDESIIDSIYKKLGISR